jgi:hypothetical protein
MPGVIHMRHKDTNLSPELRGKLRKFYRLLMSRGDFKQAHYVASYILDQRLHDSQDRRLLEALNCAMIIAYCRPFSGNDRRVEKKVPDLPASFLKGLSQAEKEIHDVVMSDRNTVLAHSDSSAFDLQPEAWKIGDRRILVPFSNDAAAPLTRDATETFQSLAKKMMEKALEERMRLEKELTNVFDEISVESIITEEEGKAG